MEIFTFVYMGGGIDRISFVPMTKQAKGMTSGEVLQTSSEERRREHAGLLGGIRTFDASEAKCANPEDLDRLLGIIETACGSLDAFSRIVRDTFEPQAKASFRAYNRKRGDSELQELPLALSLSTAPEGGGVAARGARSKSVDVHMPALAEADAVDVRVV